MSDETEYRVATADGVGAGRFLALSLADALDGGGKLVSVTVSSPERWPRTIEFAFEFPESPTLEVVMAQMSGDGQVLRAELLRRSVGGAPVGTPHGA